MPKYVTTGHVRWSETQGDVQDYPITVFEDNDPVATGVFDKHGNQYFRVKDRVPLGFHTTSKR